MCSSARYGSRVHPAPSRSSRVLAWALAACLVAASCGGPASPSAASVSAAPTSAARAERTSARTATARARPVIVVDPGHSPAISAIDPRTGLNVSDYENEPEMRDVFNVAVRVANQLRAAGYRVILTKKRVRQRVSLARRAAIANRAHAALALSIHDQAGRNGGLDFDSRNNVVYYQSVGTYRQTPSGRKVFFTRKRVAARSKRYGLIFRRWRHRTEHHHISLRGNVGYDLGSRGLPAGNIWLVQLLSHVPWIYNEAGGNSAGRVGLSRADKRTYARALVAAVEHCVPAG